MQSDNICKIITRDSVWTELNSHAADNLRNLLSYEYDLWIPGRFGKRKKTVKKYLIEAFSQDSHYMLTGYVDKCLTFLDKYDIPYEYSSDVEIIEYDEPEINGIEFRPYQLDAINAALEAGRGIIKAATGMGKSYIILGIMSAFSQENILFLVHTTDLVYQMKADLDKFGFPCGVWTGKDKFLDRITVATVQSYKKIAREHTNHWDVVFVDEVQMVSSVNKGNYYEALALTGAPCKFGLTATIPEKTESEFAIEGLIGPIIYELNSKAGAKLGFLAKADIKMISVESPMNIWNSKSYQESYKYGIVHNVNRNSNIAVEAEREIERGGTVLILVTQIEHTRQLQEIIDFPLEIVKGEVSKDERSRIKEEMKSGKLNCVIATVSWAVGIDIPTLTCVINGGGGKSEVQTLQKLGRGLRKTKTKDSVLVVDFMDIGNKYLENHSVTRRDMYEKEGWKVKIA